MVVTGRHRTCSCAVMRADYMVFSHMFAADLWNCLHAAFPASQRVGTPTDTILDARYTAYTACIIAMIPKLGMRCDTTATVSPVK